MPVEPKALPARTRLQHSFLKGREAVLINDYRSWPFNPEDPQTTQEKQSSTIEPSTLKTYELKRANLKPAYLTRPKFLVCCHEMT